MNHRTTRTLTSLAGVALTAGVAQKLRDPATRVKVERSARVYRLTARNGVRFVQSRAQGIGRGEERRAELDEQFAIRTAEDVAVELGQMKGVLMKAGQMVSFVIEALPDEAQNALASLQADAPPMAPSLAAEVVERELGDIPERVFLDWDPVPVAAASIGQVHRAVTRDGREVAVKVQYPGIDDALGADLAQAEVLYGMFSAFALKSLDVQALVDELRVRMVDELDYRIEAQSQTEFADRYDGHPFIRVPHVIPELSTQRVLTSEWVDGISFAEFEATATESERQRAAEILFRFVQGSIYLDGVFNGDPQPGNYLFNADGSMTFLDFGLVKRWGPNETDVLWPLIDPLISGDADKTVAHMVDAGFLAADHALNPAEVWEYVSRPYVPYLTDEFTFSREFVKETVGAILDVRGPYRHVLEELNLPASFVLLDRVVWGMSALLGRLGAHNRWNDLLDEYRKGALPTTELGRQEAAWRAGQRAR